MGLKLEQNSEQCAPARTLVASEHLCEQQTCCWYWVFHRRSQVETRAYGHLSSREEECDLIKKPQVLAVSQRSALFLRVMKTKTDGMKQNSPTLRTPGAAGLD